MGHGGWAQIQIIFRVWSEFKAELGLRIWFGLNGTYVLEAAVSKMSESCKLTHLPAWSPWMDT